MRDTVKGPQPNRVMSLDTMLYPIGGYEHSIRYDSLKIYIDGDNQVDVTLKISHRIDYKDRTKSLEIRVQNGFEIAIDESFQVNESDFNENYTTRYDTVLITIPKILDYGDTLSNQLEFKSGKYELALYDWNWINDYYAQRTITEWVDAGAKYIGLRNPEKNLYCWIKLKVLDFDKVKLRSYLYVYELDHLIIIESYDR